jgi:bacteriorhodopsin
MQKYIYILKIKLNFFAFIEILTFISNYKIKKLFKKKNRVSAFGFLWVYRYELWILNQIFLSSGFN